MPASISQHQITAVLQQIMYMPSASAAKAQQLPTNSKRLNGSPAACHLQ